MGTERAAPYVGPDRRRRLGDRRRPGGRRFLAAGSLLLLLWGTLALARAMGWTVPSRDAPPSLAAALASVTATLGMAVAVIYLLRWRMIGETASFRVAFGMTALSITFALGTAATVAPGWLSTNEIASARAGFGLVALVALVRAVAGGAIDTRIRPGVSAMSALGAAVGVALVVRSMGSTAQLLGAGASDSTVHEAGQLLVALLWAPVAVAFALRGLRQDRWLFTWLGLMLFGLSFGALGAAGFGGDAVGSAGVALFRLTGMLFALYGGAEELRRAWLEQQERLLRTEADLQIREARRLLEEAREQERRHDARSALFAIQGAVFGLGIESAAVAPEERQALARALTAEIGRLERLVAETPAPPSLDQFALGESLRHVALCHRSGDLGLRFEIPEDVWAWGREDDTAETVQILLDNARRHAPGSPVLVRARRELGNVVVRVEDRGPGIDPTEREAIFERGRKGARGARDGSGLGLYTARRLMREQGGDLWVEGRPGGGSCFVLFLPCADAPEPRAHKRSEMSAVSLEGPT